MGVYVLRASLPSAQTMRHSHGFEKRPSGELSSTERAGQETQGVFETKLLDMNDLNLLRKIGKLESLVEFKPGHHYLAIFDGKKFSYDQAHALLRQLEEDGVEFSLHIVGTLFPKAIEIHSAEKDGDEVSTS